MSPTSATVRARALAATDALPPTFPIGTFVAANPLHGLEHLPVEQAALVAARTTGADSYLPESEYRELFAAGRIRDIDLRRALLRRWPRTQRPASPDDPDFELALGALVDEPVAPLPSRSVHTRVAASDEHAARAIDSLVARWCAAYLDRGQADWVLPRRQLGLYGAWHRLAPRDPGLARLAGRAARARVRTLPPTPTEALAELVGRLRIDDGSVADYFRAHLRSLPGWSAAISGSGDAEDLVGLLALRLALEHLVLGELPDTVEPWRAPEPLAEPLPASIERRAVWQEALELAYRDELLATLAAPAGGEPPIGQPEQVETQVVMCIDVRSEGFRRHLEQVGPHRTLGFAGFFGLPVRVADLDHDPVPSCPVIVEPRATVREVPDADGALVQRRADRHRAESAAWDARHGAKTSPTAPFAFAEAAGWVLGPLAALHTIAPRAGAALRRRTARAAVPALRTHMDVGPEATEHHSEGFSPDEQVRVAHGALTTMGLTEGFAALVVLCGHRSATTNNPFAAALDCGACAGKAGGPNARALAELLNRPSVRHGLAMSGISVPDGTWFVAAEHETTTDTVRVLDRHRVPEQHRERLERLERDLVAAGRALAQERLELLPGDGRERDGARAVRRRSADWAEPLPEWGLARNAAVVVGPRSLTAGHDLQRRVFLHSYDPVADVDGVALGAILTGPLVVGHWISSQYYFSTVDPLRHGAGTKPLHNVVAGLGVHEGPGGDLRVGLPLESVQFAGQRVHEPLRLLAVVRAPRARLDRLIAQNSAVAGLLDHGWIRLVAGDESEGWAERLRGGTWEPCEGPFEGSAGTIASGSHAAPGHGPAGSMGPQEPVGAGISVEAGTWVASA